MSSLPTASVNATGGGGGASPAQAAACQQTHAEYQQCLAKAGRKNFNSCSDYYGKLRACEKVKPDPATHCSKQFLAMRECHRPLGPHLLPAPSTSVLSSRENIHSYAANTENSTGGGVSSNAVSAADWQQLHQPTGGYELRADVLKEYNVTSADLGPAAAPKGRSGKRLEAAAQGLKQQLQLPTEEFIAYKWESLRPRPGA